MLQRTKNHSKNRIRVRRTVRKRLHAVGARFRFLVARLQCGEDGKAGPCQTLGVIGSERGVGASTVAVNVAIAAASTTSQTVLLVDADGHVPSVGTMLAGKPAPGLAEVLTGLADPEDCVQSTQVEDLWLLAAGDDGQMSACNRATSSALLQKLKEKEFVPTLLKPI